MSDVPNPADFPALLSKALQATNQRISAVPNDAMYDSIKNQLEFIRSCVETGRKPTEEEKRSLTIGVYAAREFETSDPEFADLLHDISYLARRL